MHTNPTVLPCPKTILAERQNPISSVRHLMSCQNCVSLTMHLGSKEIRPGSDLCRTPLQALRSDNRIRPCCRTATPLPPGDALRSDLLPNRRLAPFERGVEENRPVVDPPPRPLPMILLLLTTELPLGRDGGWKRCDEEVPLVPSRHS